MPVSHGQGDLIAAIYDASIEPSGWDEIVKRIVEATKSVSGCRIQMVENAEHLSALYNMDPFYVDAYAQTWYKQNPLSVAAAAIAPGELRTATGITQTDAYRASARASAFFNQFVRPQGWGDFVAIGLLHAPKAYRILSLQRSPEAIWVEPAEWNLLETLALHLQRASAIHDLLARTRVTTDSLGEAVATAGFAVFLLTGDCRVVFANAKAEDLLRQERGLCFERGRLAAATPVLSHRLHALARQGMCHQKGEAHAGGTIELSCGDRPPLLAHVIPLAANRATIFDVDRPAAACFVVDPAANLDATAQRFAARYGLTGAETRVFLELVRGNGRLVAAARLKLTEATVCTHAGRILAKTKTTRQTELIRRFF